jgi:Sulfotransferase family
MRTVVRRVVPFSVRRAAWRAHRNTPRLIQPLSRVLPRADAPNRPILLVGCPRSGTGILLDVLRQSAALRSIQDEGHILWQPYHHPRDRGWDSDALDADDVSRREQEYIYLAVRLLVGDRRFLDKTPESCLRIPYLRALFPDASFVFLRRRAADNVSSLMEGWRARPRFVTYRLPEPLTGLGSLSGNRWSFVLIPEWRELRSSPLEEICAHQYITCNEAVLDARERDDPTRWLDVTYEDLIADPVAESERLYDGLGLRFTSDARHFAANLTRRPSRTSLTPPRPEKWREQNRAAIERIQPLVASTEKRLGW